MKRTKYEIVKKHTNDMSILWKECRGIAPDSVADKMDDAMLRWMVELTETLSIWIERGNCLTDGELILARTNMGALVESWLKFFYCAFYEDYMKNPKIERGKIIEPNKLSFEQLKEFSVGILWKDKSDSMYKWVDKIQHYRNAIHAFNYRDIGTAIEFINDMDIFYDYVEMILKKIPSVEDYLEYYPIGYDINPYYAD